eukprot:TRINITY_DN1045_c0_g1_i1.p6 TRINITY_DN1045_c0_g1~~TRINITY_DN1045_c0_g1_i1.p6  ORF type:complete len:457 (+),score=129.72 TRINITY_DN1045_c0_g1_i1:33-1373(+)
MSESLESLWATLQQVMSPHGEVAVSGRSYVPGDFSIHFFLQLAVILMACRLVGWFGKKVLGQPQVVGEMIAGVILGPSIFGLLLPEVFSGVFPPQSRNVLYVGGQLGVGLYMFLVGTTLRLDHLKAKARSAVGVSLAGIVVPFLMAILITPLVLDFPGLFAEGLSRVNATLFLGACIALTAFPMLARIINERGLANSSLGTLSLTAGAFDDVCSWCVLAIVLATFGGGAGVAILAIGGGIAWTLLVLTLGPKLLAPLARIVEREGEVNTTILASVLALFATSAFFMDAIGIHAIFGGFLVGTIIPRGVFAEQIKRKLEPLVVVMLLPLFFTYSGLNTRIDVVDSLELVGLAVGILVVSILAKGGACYLAARLVGEDNRTSLAIGALMNSRGLMELIIINIGLQKQIIGPGLFAMLVLMAIVTTSMAGPLFEFVYGRHARRAGLITA